MNVISSLPYRFSELILRLFCLVKQCTKDLMTLTVFLPLLLGLLLSRPDRIPRNIEDMSYSFCLRIKQIHGHTLTEL